MQSVDLFPKWYPKSRAFKGHAGEKKKLEQIATVPYI